MNYLKITMDNKLKKKKKEQVNWKVKDKWNLIFIGFFLWVLEMVRNFSLQHFLSENSISSEQNNLCGKMSIMTKWEGGAVNESFQWYQNIVFWSVSEHYQHGVSFNYNNFMVWFKSEDWNKTFKRPKMGLSSLPKSIFLNFILFHFLCLQNYIFEN